MRRTVMAITAMLLALGLSACVDADLEIALTGPGTASASLTQVMRQDAFTTISLVDTLDENARQATLKAIADGEKAIAAAEASGKDASGIIVPAAPDFQYPLAAQFCTSGRMLKRVDGGATCLDTSEGPFDEIVLGALDEQVRFAPQPDGSVRIALDTAQLRRALTWEATLDADLDAAIPALLAGRRITVTFKGAQVTETNMTLAKTGTAASQNILLLDLFTGEAALPAELYAVVTPP